MRDASRWLPWPAANATCASFERRSDAAGRGGSLVAAEVVQGVRDEKPFNLARKTLDAFRPVDLAGCAIAVKEAGNFRLPRTTGITVRETIDQRIATRCIEAGPTLMPRDRDFDRFVQRLGLKVAYPQA